MIARMSSGAFVMAILSGSRASASGLYYERPSFVVRRLGNVGGQRAPDRKRRALHQAEIGARAGPIWHYVALRGTTWHKINPYM